VDSREKEGATFTFTLTLASPEVFILSESDEFADIVCNSINSTGKGYSVQKFSNLSSVKEALQNKFPSYLAIDVVNGKLVDEIRNEIKTNNLLKRVPLLVFKDEYDEMDKKIIENNIAQIFFKPLEQESLSYYLTKTLL
jgi:hypothetical protein